MEVLLLLVMGVMNIACFVIGAKVGQTVANGEEVKLPAVKPAEEVQVQPVQTEEEMEKNQFNIIMQNVDNYDGTSQGQVDVPWR